jgi:poly(A) polymerase
MPVALAQRLQLPQQQQRWLAQQEAFLAWLEANVLPQPWCQWSAAQWSERLEAERWPAEVVALQVALNHPCWRPLLRWWGRWRHVMPSQSASELMAAGIAAGPALGEALRRSRLQRLETLR